MEKGRSISKKMAVVLQGIAVLLMVVHHLFDFPAIVKVPFVNVFGFVNLEILMGNFGKICVAMFAFLSGFGLYKKFSASLSEKKFPILQCYAGMAKQLWGFLKRFWLVFAVFIPYGFIQGIYNFGAYEFFKNLFGFTLTYNKEWWYVRQYFDLLLLFPLLFCVEKWLVSIIRVKHNELISGAILLIPLAVLFYWQNRIYDFCFLVGFLCVSTGIFDWLCDLFDKTKGWKYVIGVALVGIAFVLRLKFLYAKYDYINVTLFILGLTVLLKAPIFEKSINVVFAYVGKYSAYIWLTHTFFSYYYFQAFTFFPKYSILIFIWCTALSLASGIGLSYLLKGISYLCSKVVKALQKPKTAVEESQAELVVEEVAAAEEVSIEETVTQETAEN